MAFRAEKVMRNGIKYFKSWLLKSNSYEYSTFRNFISFLDEREKNAKVRIVFPESIPYYGECDKRWKQFFDYWEVISDLEEEYKKAKKDFSEYLEKQDKKKQIRSEWTKYEQERQEREWKEQEEHELRSFKNGSRKHICFDCGTFMKNIDDLECYKCKSHKIFIIHPDGFHSIETVKEGFDWSPRDWR